MRSAQVSAIWGILCLAAASGPCLGEGGCARVLRVREVVRDARSLDGTIRCVRGLLTPKAIPQWHSASLVYELLPLRREQAPKFRQALGVIEWSPETGVDEALYNPDSFDLLNRATQAGGPTVAKLDVTIRVAVEYKKDLFRRLPQLTPENPRVE